MSSAAPETQLVSLGGEQSAAQSSPYCVLYDESTIWGRHRVLATRVADTESALSIAEAAKNAGFTQVQHSRFIVGGLRLKFVKQGSSTLETLAIDLIDPRSLMFASFDELMGRSEENINAAPIDEFSFLVACSVRGISLTLEQRERLKKLSCTMGRSALTYFFKVDFFNSLRYWSRAVIRQPLAVAVHAASEMARRMRLFLRPTGLFIVILGPDGAGKSTSKNVLRNHLSAVFTKVLSWHWRPGVIWRPGPAMPFRRPHSKPPRGTLASIFYVMAVFADTWAGYLRSGRRVLASGGLLTCDRYFSDLLVDPRRYRYSGPRWFPNLLAKFVPGPDLVIVLDAEEEIMFDRKPELSLEELRRQRIAYARVAEALPNAWRVRADVSIEQTSRNVVGHVVEFLSSRIPISVPRQ